MIGLDTNVLVRWLVQDDPAQSRRANRLIERALSAGDFVHVDVVVLCEVVWVLRAAYALERIAIADALDQLMDAAQFSIDDRDLVREASRLYRDGKGDFADYVIALRHKNAGCDTTATFDRAHRGDELFDVLAS